MLMDANTLTLVEEIQQECEVAAVVGLDYDDNQQDVAASDEDDEKDDAWLLYRRVERATSERRFKRRRWPNGDASSLVVALKKGVFPSPARLCELLLDCWQPSLTQRTEMAECVRSWRPIPCSAYAAELVTREERARDAPLASSLPRLRYCGAEYYQFTDPRFGNVEFPGTIVSTQLACQVMFETEVCCCYYYEVTVRCHPSLYRVYVGWAALDDEIVFEGDEQQSADGLFSVPPTSRRVVVAGVLVATDGTAALAVDGELVAVKRLRERTSKSPRFLYPWLRILEAKGSSSSSSSSSCSSFSSAAEKQEEKKEPLRSDGGDDAKAAESDEEENDGASAALCTVNLGANISRQQQQRQQQHQRPFVYDPSDLAAKLSLSPVDCLDASCAEVPARLCINGGSDDTCPICSLGAKAFERDARGATLELILKVKTTTDSILAWRCDAKSGFAFCLFTSRENDDDDDDDDGCAYLALVLFDVRQGKPANISCFASVDAKKKKIRRVMLNSWHHVAFGARRSRRGDDVSLFVNGNKLETKRLDTAAVGSALLVHEEAATKVVALRQRRFGTESAFVFGAPAARIVSSSSLKEREPLLEGEIGEARLWTERLSRRAVASAFSGDFHGDEPRLAACWPFDEASGAAVRNVVVDAPKSWLEPPLRIEDGCSTWMRGFDEGGTTIPSYLAVGKTAELTTHRLWDDDTSLFFDDDDADESMKSDVISHARRAIVLDAERALFCDDDPPPGEKDGRTLVLNAICARIFRLSSAALASHSTDARRLRAAVDDALFFVTGNGDSPSEDTILAVTNFLSAAESSITILAAARWLRASLAALCETCALNSVSTIGNLTESLRERILSVSLSILSRSALCPDDCALGSDKPKVGPCGDVVSLEICALLTEGRNLELFLLKAQVHCPVTFVDTLTTPKIPESLRQRLFDSVARRRRLLYALVPVIIRPRVLVDVALDLEAVRQAMKDDACAVPRIGDICRHARANALGVIVRVIEEACEADDEDPVARVFVEWFSHQHDQPSSPSSSSLPFSCRVRLKSKESDIDSLKRRSRKSRLVFSKCEDDDDVAVIVRDTWRMPDIRSRDRLISHAKEMFSPTEFDDLRDCNYATLYMEIKNGFNDRFVNEIEFCDCRSRFSLAVSGATCLQRLLDFLLPRITHDRSSRRLFFALVEAVTGASLCRDLVRSRVSLAGEAPLVLVRIATRVANTLAGNTRDCTHLLRAMRATFEGLTRFDGYSGNQELLNAALSVVDALDEIRVGCDNPMATRGLDLLVCRVISDCCARIFIPRSLSEAELIWWKYWLDQVPQLRMADLLTPTDEEDPKRVWIKQLLADDQLYADLDVRMTRLSRIPAAFLQIGGPALDEACRCAVVAALYHSPVCSWSDAAIVDGKHRESLVAIWRQIPRFRTWAKAQPDPMSAAERVRRNALFLLSVSTRQPLLDESVQHDPIALFRLCREARPEELYAVKRVLAERGEDAKSRMMALNSWRLAYTWACKDSKTGNVAQRRIALMQCFSPLVLNRLGLQYLPRVLAAIEANELSEEKLRNWKANGSLNFGRWLVKSSRKNLSCRELYKFRRLSGVPLTLVEGADRALDNVYADISGLAAQGDKLTLLSLAAAWTSRIVYLAGLRDALTVSLVSQLMATSIRLEKQSSMLSSIKSVAIRLGLLACQSAIGPDRDSLNSELRSIVRPCLSSSTSRETTLRLLLLTCPSLFASDSQWIELFTTSSSESWRAWRLFRNCLGVIRTDELVGFHGFLNSALDSVAARFRYDEAIFQCDQECSRRGNVLAAAAEACALLRHLLGHVDVCTLLAKVLADGRRLYLCYGNAASGALVVSDPHQVTSSAARCLAALQVLGGFRERPTVGAQVLHFATSPETKADCSTRVFVVKDVREDPSGTEVCSVVNCTGSQPVTETLLTIPARELAILRPIRLDWTNSAGVTAVATEIGELLIEILSLPSHHLSTWCSLVRGGAACCARLICTGGGEVYPPADDSIARLGMQALYSKLRYIGAPMLSKAIELQNVAGIAACNKVEVSVDVALDKARNFERRERTRLTSLSQNKRTPGEPNTETQSHFPLLSARTEDGSRLIASGDQDRRVQPTAQVCSTNRRTTATTNEASTDELHSTSNAEEEVVSGLAENAISSRTGSVASPLVSLLVEMGFSEDLCARALELTDNDVEAALHLMLDDVSISIDDDEDETESQIDEDAEDRDDQKRNYDDEGGEPPRVGDVGARGHRDDDHDHDEEHNDEDSNHSEPSQNLVSAVLEQRRFAQLHSGEMRQNLTSEAPAKSDPDVSSDFIRTDDDKIEDRALTSKADLCNVGRDHFHDPGDVETHSASAIADVKDACAEAHDETSSVEQPSALTPVTFEHQDRSQHLMSHDSSPGLGATFRRVRHRAHVEEDDDDSRWPRMYHVSTRSTIALRAFPRATAARVTEVRGGDELVALGESGDWLQVSVLVSSRHNVSLQQSTASGGGQQSVSSSLFVLPQGMLHQQRFPSSRAGPASAIPSNQTPSQFTDEGNHPLPLSSGGSGFVAGLSTENLRELAQGADTLRTSDLHMIERAASESSAGVSVSQASEITAQGDLNRGAQSQQQYGQMGPRRSSAGNVPSQSAVGDLQEISECSSVASDFYDGGNLSTSATISTTHVSRLRSLVLQQHQRGSPSLDYRHALSLRSADEEDDINADTENGSSVGEGAVAASGSMLARGDESVAESSLLYYALSNEGVAAAGSVVSETDRGTVFMFGENMSERESNIWGIESVRDDASLVSTSRGDVGPGDDGNFLFSETLVGIDDIITSSQGQQRRVSVPSPVLVDSLIARSRFLQGSTGWIEKSRVKPGPCALHNPLTDEDQPSLASLSSPRGRNLFLHPDERQISELKISGESHHDDFDKNEVVLQKAVEGENGGARDAAKDATLENLVQDHEKSVTSKRIEENVDATVTNIPNSQDVRNQRDSMPDVSDSVDAHRICAFPLLESETGDEFYHRDDRYFGTRQGDAPSRGDDFRRPSPLKEGVSRQASEATLAVSSKKKRDDDEPCRRSVSADLAGSIETTVSLQFRFLSLGLILHWSALEANDLKDTSLRDKVVEFFTSSPSHLPSVGYRATARNIVALYQLLMFRDWTPDWWPASLVDCILGSPLTFPLGGATLPALMSPLLVQLVAFGDSSDTSASEIVARFIREDLVGEVCSQLTAASAGGQKYTTHKPFPRVSDSRRQGNQFPATDEGSMAPMGHPLGLTDFEVESRCCLPWAQWVTRLIFMHVPLHTDSVDPAFSTLFREWLGCLSTTDLRLKQHAASELAAMLSTLVKLKSQQTLAACAKQLPLNRLRHLASWRLVREADDYPVVSRYLQAIIDLVATAFVAEDYLEITSNGIVEDAEEDLTADVERPKVVPEEISGILRQPRYALNLPGEGSMVVGSRDVSPPWTAEFYLYRHEDDAEPLCLSPSSGDDELQWLPSICLAATPFTGHTIRLQKGGALIPGSTEARKFCVGGSTFDFEVPCGRWVHIALVARERSPNSSVMLCGPNAFWEHEVIPGDKRVTEVSRLRHVVELFADGESKGTVSLRAPLPCGLVGLDCPPSTRAVVDTSGVLRIVSDENDVCEILRRRHRDSGYQRASRGESKRSLCANSVGIAHSFANEVLGDNDNVHHIVDEAGTCAARSPRCFFGLVRYWSVARTAADIKRYMGKRPPEIATTGLLGSWELAFEDICSASQKSIAPRFVFDSTEQHMGCALRGDATWTKLPTAAETVTLLEDHIPVCSPDHDTCRDVVLHGTVLRRAILGVTHGPFCRDCKEALILRLSISGSKAVSGIAEWHDRGIACTVSGSVTSHTVPDFDNEISDELFWGLESSFELSVGELVLGSDDVAVSHLCTAQELVRYDDERGLDECCILSPRGAKIVGNATFCIPSTNDVRNLHELGSWTGEIVFERSIARTAVCGLQQVLPKNFEAKTVTCRIDEVALPDSLCLRPVYGDYVQDGDDTASVRRLLVSSPFGGRFLAHATVLHGEDDLHDEIFPPLPHRLEIAKNRAEDVGETAGELSVRASILARDAADELVACASSLEGAIDENATSIARMSLEERVRVALDVAVRAADARRSAIEANATALDFDAASERLRRRNVGPPPVSDRNFDLAECSSLEYSESPQTGSQTAVIDRQQPSTQACGRAGAHEAHTDDEIHDRLATDSISHDDGEDDNVNEQNACTNAIPAQGQRKNELGRHARRLEDAELRYWGIGSRCGKWCWEWDVRRIGSGELAIGVRGLSANSAQTLGSDNFGWAYSSTGEVSHGGHRFKATSFGPGDIIGVEVEIYREVYAEQLGRVRFFKNGTEVEPLAEESESTAPTREIDRPRASLTTTSSSRSFGRGTTPNKAVRDVDAILGINADLADTLIDKVFAERRGLRATTQVGGAGDAVVLLGFKRGFGVRHYASQVPGRAPADRVVAIGSYRGDWGHTGVRHGRGELSFTNCEGRWIGTWFKDKQHGVHLWVEREKITPVLFERGKRVRTVISDEDAVEEMNAYSNGLFDSSEQTQSITIDRATLTSTGENGCSEDGRESSWDAQWILRVVYQQGATVRRGIEIDTSEVVRRVAVGEELEATERAVTADGVPRYRVRLQNKQKNSFEYGWISEHLRGGARDQVCVVLRHLLCSKECYLRYRVVRPGGAMIRTTSSLDGSEVGLAPQATALWVAERLRLPNGTLRLRIVAPERWIGWASEKEHIVSREPTSQDLAREAMSRDRARIRVESMKSQAAKNWTTTRQPYLARDDVKKELAGPSEAPADIQVTATFESSRKSPFLLDRRQCASNISISPDLLTASGAAPRRGCGVVLGTKRMRRGIHYWEVRVEQATWGSVFIGVAALGDVVGAGSTLSDVGSNKRNSASDSKSAAPLRRQSHSASRNQSATITARSSLNRLLAPRHSQSSRSLPSTGWGGLGFMNYRATQAYGAEAAYGSYIGAGDIIGVLLNADKGTISFVKDGDDFIAGRPVVANLGVAFSSIWRRAASRSPASRAGLYACLGIKGEGDRLSLVASKAWSSEEDPSGNDLPPRLARLGDIVNALVMLDGWRTHVRLMGKIKRPHHRQRGWRLVMESADRIHRRWRTCQMRASVKNRALCDVELDTSSRSILATAVASGLPTSWASVSLRLGSPCRILQGEVRIIGVARGQVWFAGPTVDEGRAWYWNAKELWTLARTGAFVSAPPLQTDGDKKSSRNEMPDDSEPIQLPRATIPLPGSNLQDVSLRSPSFEVNVDETTVSGESALLEPIDFLNSSEEDADEAKIDTCLASLVDTLAVSLGVPPTLVPASTLASALCLEPSSVGDGNWYATRPESLRGVLAKTISKRLAIVSALNDAVATALPYVDFGRGDLALAEIGDLTGGVLNSGALNKEHNMKTLVEEASGNKGLGRTAASSTSYYGALAVARTLPGYNLEWYGHDSANQASVGRAATCTQTTNSGVVEQEVRDARVGIEDDWSKNVAGAMYAQKSYLSWGPESWWGGAVPPRSEDDVRCCSRIPALDALLNPAARSWTGGRAILALRDQIFYQHVKRSFFAQILKATTTFTSPPPDEYDRPDELREFRVNRLVSTRNSHAKRKELKVSEKKFQIPRIAEDSEDDDGSISTEAPSRLEARIERQTVFGQLHSQMRSRCDARMLRRSFVHVQDRGQPRAFYVKFVGEGVDDHGGPYRAIFQSALAEEPKQSILALLRGERAAGDLVPRADAEFRDVDDELYRNFGRLLGVAGRHKVPIDVSLSHRAFWRPLAAHSAVIPRSSDSSLDGDESALLAMQAALFVTEDEKSVFSARDLVLDVFRRIESRNDASLRRNIRLGQNVDANIAFSSHHAVVYGVARQLAAQDGDVQISSERLSNVCKQLLVLHGTRARALASVARGAAATLPVELFSLFDANQLEEVICGRSGVDVNEIRRTTTYEGIDPSDQHVQYFWEALDTFDTHEMAEFVEFCSGSSRMPRSDGAHGAQCLKLTAPPPGISDKDPDEYLPVSQTCFFSLALPRYSSAAVCARKLRYAVSNAHLMDADFLMRHTEGWDALDENDDDHDGVALTASTTTTTIRG